MFEKSKQRYLSFIPPPRWFFFLFLAAGHKLSKFTLQRLCCLLCQLPWTQGTRVCFLRTAGFVVMVIHLYDATLLTKTTPAEIQ